MKHLAFATLFALMIAVGVSADDKKGGEVILDGLKSKTPADWKEEEPSNNMRFAQFKLPKAGEDKDDAELIIFKNLGGSAKDNVARWKGQFLPPEGKTIDDVAKVTEIKIGGMEATLVDVTGTYLFKARPIDPTDKAVRKPGYRMLAIHFKNKDNLYHIKLTGPAATVEKYKKGFDEWIANFK
jgi:hypothetical protein